MPPMRSRNVQHAFDKQPYKTRHKIEKILGKRKERRHDRSAHTFSSAICNAASVLFYPNQ